MTAWRGRSAFVTLCMFCGLLVLVAVPVAAQDSRSDGQGRTAIETKKGAAESGINRPNQVPPRGAPGAPDDRKSSSERDETTQQSGKAGKGSEGKKIGAGRQ